MFSVFAARLHLECLHWSYSNYPGYVLTLVRVCRQTFELGLSIDSHLYHTVLTSIFFPGHPQYVLWILLAYIYLLPQLRGWLDIPRNLVPTQHLVFTIPSPTRYNAIATDLDPLLLTNAADSISHYFFGKPNPFSKFYVSIILTV